MGTEKTLLAKFVHAMRIHPDIVLGVSVTFSSYHYLSIVKLPLFSNSKSFLVKGKLYLAQIILVNRAIRSLGNICDNVCMILTLYLFKIVQAIMKALEDARKQDPNVKVAEVTITKQETEDGD